MNAAAFPRPLGRQQLVGADESFARVPLEQLRASGITRLLRYITGDGKGLSQAEFDAIIGAGFELAWVMETYAQAASLGYDQGVKEATAAYAAADAIGWPRDRPGYFVAEDPYPVAVGAWPAVAEYFRGVIAAGPGRPLPGAYGSGAICAHLAELGLVGHQWHVSTWPGLDRAVADIVQEANGLDGYGTFGGSIDLDTIRDDNPDWGQHPYAGGPGPVQRVATYGWEEIHSYLHGLGIPAADPSVAQSTGGQHATNSEHYPASHPPYPDGVRRGHAVDYGLYDEVSDLGAIVAALEPLAQGPDPAIVELFWPDGGWSHGTWTGEIDVPNHLHAAIAYGRHLPVALIPSEEEDMAQSQSLAVGPGGEVSIALPQIGNTYGWRSVSVTLTGGRLGVQCRAVLGPGTAETGWRGFDPDHPEDLVLGPGERRYVDLDGSLNELQVTNHSAEQALGVLIESSR